MTNATTNATTDERLQRETPKWFDDAKLGVLLTWSAAAIPAYAPLTRIQSLHHDMDLLTRLLPHAEMYQLPLSILDSPTARHHAETYGDLPYDRFVEQFRDEVIPRWDPEPWAELLALGGVRYVNLCSKFEDGFLLWPSAHPNPKRERWQTDRDLVGEFAAAVRSRGVRFGAYYCGGVDWTYAGLPGTSDPSELFAAPHDPGYLKLADAHWRELIDRYEPSVLWNDYSMPPEADLVSLFTHFLDVVPEGVINNRFDGDPFEPSAVYDDFQTPEYSTKGSPERKWEACRGMGLSFGFNREEISEKTYNSSAELIHMFIDIVARGGNLMLSISPTGNGDVPWPQAERLLAIGQWLRINGDAIYGTRPWERQSGVAGDGLELRFTASDDAVNAIVLGSPRRADVDLDVGLDEEARVSFAGRRGDLPWRPTAHGVRVHLPERPFEEPALALRLEPKSAVRPKP